MCHTLTLQPIPQSLYILSHCRVCPYLLLCNLTLSPNHDACCQGLLVNINPTTIVKYCFHCTALLFKIRLKNNKQYTMKIYHCGAIFMLLCAPKGHDGSYENTHLVIITQIVFLRKRVTFPVAHLTVQFC